MQHPSDFSNFLQKWTRLLGLNIPKIAADHQQIFYFGERSLGYV